jgi:hypothetical protein
MEVVVVDLHSVLADLHAVRPGNWDLRTRRVQVAPGHIRITVSRHARADSPVPTLIPSHTPVSAP